MLFLCLIYKYGFKEEYLLRVKDTSELDEIKDKYVNESDFRQKIALKKRIEAS